MESNGSPDGHDEPYEIGNYASAAKTNTVIKYESPSNAAFATVT